MVTPDLYNQLKQSALLLLSRREYSRHELQQRLARREGAEELLDALLEQLQQQGLQSDLRYAESLLRSRISRGQGPQRIVQELRAKGVAEQLGQQVMAECEQDWYALARSVRERRFGDPLPLESREKGKQWRFLAYRGFDQDQLRYALSEPEGD